jgi:hypothetical protein
MQAPPGTSGSRTVLPPADSFTTMPAAEARPVRLASPRPSVLATYWNWLSESPTRGTEGGEARRLRRARVPTLALPRRMKQRGRSVLLWTLAFYAVAQLGLTFSMEQWLPVAFRSLLRAKWQQLGEISTSNPGRPLLVMLGSSRTEYALRAERLDDLAGPDGQRFIAYNYGMPALGPLYAGLSLREMLEAGIRPRLLLVEYLPPLLNEPRKGCISEEAWTAASWLTLPQVVRLWPYFKRPDQKARDWLEARVAPWYVFRREIQAWCNGKVHPNKAVVITVPYDSRGHKNQDECSDEEWLNRRRQTFGLYHDSLSTLHVGDGPTRSLRDLLAICKREQIRAVIVAMPESSTFRSWYSDEALAEIHGLLADLHDRHGAGVIDASAWLDDNEFVDYHHVTTEGSRLFSARLHDELQHLLAQQETGNAQP